MDDGLPQCDVRRPTSEVPSVSASTASPAVASAALSVDGVAPRASHLAPTARRVRRIRVGKDGLFPW